MKRIALFLSLAACLLGGAHAQEGKENPVLLAVGDDSVTLSDFLKSYAQNLPQDKQGVLNREDLEDYLQMYIDFRLKVKAAEDAGADTMRLLQSELQEYRMQLARPYLMDTAMMQELIDEACSDMHAVANFRQIVVPLDRYARPADTLAAYNKCMEIRKQLLDGADFSELAWEYSADYADYKATGRQWPEMELVGMSGYITAFEREYAIEKQVFSLPLGEISMPVRISRGYALLQVLDRRPSKGQMMAAHIFITVNPQDSLLDSPEEVQGRILEIYDSLQAGMDFYDAARKFSMDKSTAVLGGSFGRAFKANQMSPEIMAQLLRLNDGEYSKPFMTHYGGHILKLISSTGVDNCDKAYNGIVRSIEKDPLRSSLPFKKFLTQQLKMHHYRWNPKVVAQIRKIMPDTIKWNSLPQDSLANPSLFSQTVLTYETMDYSAWDFIRFMDRKIAKRTEIPAVDVWYGVMKSEYEQSAALRYEMAGLEDNYPEFKAVMEEYRDGVYLFDISNKEVWGRAVSDTIGLQSYYQENTNSYMQPEKACAWVVRVDDALLSKKVGKVLVQAYKKGWDFSELKLALDKKFGSEVRLDSNAYAKGMDPFVDDAEWVPGFLGEVWLEGEIGRCAYVWIKGIVEPEPYALEDVRGKVISDYQVFLEDAWVKQLRARYKVRVFEDVFDSIFQK